jgi:hypothetical protein
MSVAFLRSYPEAETYGVKIIDLEKNSGYLVQVQCTYLFLQILKYRDI